MLNCCVMTGLRKIRYTEGGSLFPAKTFLPFFKKSMYIWSKTMLQEDCLGYLDVIWYLTFYIWISIKPGVDKILHQNTLYLYYTM